MLFVQFIPLHIQFQIKISKCFFGAVIARGGVSPGKHALHFLLALQPQNQQNKSPCGLVPFALAGILDTGVTHAASAKLHDSERFTVWNKL